MWEDIADCSGSVFSQVFYTSHSCNLYVQRRKLLHLQRAYEFLISRRVFQSDTLRVPIITLPFTENMSWTTPPRTIKKKTEVCLKNVKKPICVLGDYDDISFSIENNKISEHNNAKAQLVPGLPVQLPISSEANQFSTSLPSVSQMTVILF